MADRSADAGSPRWLLKEGQVARLLGVSVRTLQEWRQSGAGPAFLKLGGGKRGAVRYDPDDVRAFVARKRVGSSGEESDPD